MRLAEPAPAPVALAAVPLNGVMDTAIGFEVVHEKLMSGMALCALSYAVAVSMIAPGWKKQHERTKPARTGTSGHTTPLTGS